MGLGLVFCASIGSAFLPPTTALGLACTAWPCTGASSSLEPSSSMTLRRLSTRQRGILQDMELLLLTLLMPASASTWTPSTSSSGLRSCWPVEEGISRWTWLVDQEMKRCPRIEGNTFVIIKIYLCLKIIFY